MDKIGKYEILEELLSTGFSDIYVAKNPDTEGLVAIKIFHPKGNNTGEKAKYGDAFWRARFLEESRLLAQFDHPNIVKAIDADETLAGDPYFVMPFMEANLFYEIGEDAETPEAIAELPPKWRPRPISPRRATEIWYQVLDALSVLHKSGLVHRDIKPPNVLLDTKTRGSVKLCDFGMVKVPDSQGSRPGVWLGTLEYISPEQRKSATDVDVRSDVYSAGVLMYRMLSGRLPTDRRAPMRAGRFDIPEGLVMLIEDCLKKKRSERPQDAGEVLMRLKLCVPDISALADTSKILSRSRHPISISAIKRKQ